MSRAAASASPAVAVQPRRRRSCRAKTWSPAGRRRPLPAPAGHAAANRPSRPASSRSNITRLTEKAPFRPPLFRSPLPQRRMSRSCAPAEQPNSFVAFPAKPETRVPPPTAVKRRPPNRKTPPKSKANPKQDTRPPPPRRPSSQAGAAPLTLRADRTAPMEATNRSPVSSSPVPSPQAPGSPTPTPSDPLRPRALPAPNRRPLATTTHRLRRRLTSRPVGQTWTTLEAEMARLLGREK